MSFDETTAAHRQTDELRTAMFAILEDSRFKQIWQVRDYLDAVLRDGDDMKSALQRVFAEQA